MSDIAVACQVQSGQSHNLTIPVRFGDSPPSEDDNRPATEKARPLDGVISRAKAIVQRAQNREFPADAKNWVRLHRLLIFEPGAFTNAEAATGSNSANVLLRSVLTAPESKYPPFIIRGGIPFPQNHGSRFDREQHQDQFLHLLSMAQIPLDARLHCGHEVFTVRDLLQASLREAQPRGELDWTVSAYAFYTQPGFQWKNKFGEQLSLAKLAGVLLSQQGTACGGAHCFGALGRILSRPELKQDMDLAALAPRIEKRLEDEIRWLQQQQQRNGRFELPPLLSRTQRNSTPEEDGLYFTGHSIEWLALALPKDRLDDQWIVDGVVYLTDVVESSFIEVLSASKFDEAKVSYTYGNLSHALSGLLRWVNKVTEK